MTRLLSLLLSLAVLLSVGVIPANAMSYPPCSATIANNCINDSGQYIPPRVGDPAPTNDQPTPPVVPTPTPTPPVVPTPTPTPPVVPTPTPTPPADRPTQQPRRNYAMFTPVAWRNKGRDLVLNMVCDMSNPYTVRDTEPEDGCWDVSVLACKRVGNSTNHKGAYPDGRRIRVTIRGAAGCRSIAVRAMGYGTTNPMGPAPVARFKLTKNKGVIAVKPVGSR
jgi:hypothetical protein